MASEELNEILINAVPNVWENQSYLQGLYFKCKTYKDTCKIFERMEITEQVYEGGTPSKNAARVDVNRASCGRKLKGR